MKGVPPKAQSIMELEIPLTRTPDACSALCLVKKAPYFIVLLNSMF